MTQLTNTKIPTETAQDRVNRLASTATRNDKGKYELSEDVSELEKVAVISELRRRDTQSDYTAKTKQIKTLEAEKQALLARAHESVPLKIAEEKQEELDDLLISDPEAWRVEMNKLENAARSERENLINEELNEVSTKTTAEIEIESNERKLAEFNSRHTDLNITSETFENDIPLNLQRKWETGKISFDELLVATHKFLTAGKSVKDKKAPKIPNMGEYGGGAKQPQTNHKVDQKAYGAETI